MENLDISIHEAQRVVDRKRVFVNGSVLEEKNSQIEGEIEVVVFQPNPLGLKPIFENGYFAFFDKPSGVLVHPRKREVIQTLSDDIKFLFGKDANVVHRIDKETSGLVLVSKDKNSEVFLKNLFESRAVKKEYMALVFGKLTESFVIDEKLLLDKEDSLVRIKVHVDTLGKDALTRIEPMSYFEKYDVTLIKAIPLTGRQHQIRAHLFHVKHPIVGDPIYGVDEEFASDFLEGKISDDERLKVTKSSRLLLHASRVVFEFNNETFDIHSPVNVEEIFLKEYCIHDKL